MQYLPFGEDFISQRIDWQTRYTFSAKEKDKNTGYHYFGARYYNSDISVWLSVDPMSDKHPDYTPYAYVYNNPVNLIDPSGLDTIIVNNRGKLGKPIEAEGDHVFVRGTNKERRTGKIDYNKNGNLRDRHKTESVDRNSIEIEKKFLGNTQIKLTGKGLDKGEYLFTFFSDNTKVEWSYNAFVDSDDLNNPKAFLFTSHSTDQVSNSRELRRIIEDPKYILISDIHSHPPDKDGTRYPYPSFGDYIYRDYVKSLGHKSTIFQVYENKGFIDYSKGGGYYDKE